MLYSERIVTSMAEWLVFLFQQIANDKMMSMFTDREVPTHTACLFVWFLKVLANY